MVKLGKEDEKMAEQIENSETQVEKLRDDAAKVIAADSKIAERLDNTD